MKTKTPATPSPWLPVRGGPWDGRTWLPGGDAEPGRVLLHKGDDPHRRGVYRVSADGTCVEWVERR